MIKEGKSCLNANPIFADVLHAPLDWRLVEQTRSSLQEASDNLIQLYKRISLDHSLDEGLRHRFLQDLVTSADVAQATLRPLTQPYVSKNIIQALSNFTESTLSLLT